MWEPGPARPSLPTANEVDVWRVELGAVTRGERREAARAALRELLGRYLGTAPAAVEFEPGEHGKPRLAGAAPALEFNLSHSGELALVAVAAAGSPVGVDVEAVKPRRDPLALARRALDAEQAARVEAAGPEHRNAVFHGAWVRHEARLKCGGGGFGGPAPAGPLRLAELDLGDGYAGAVALAGEQPPLPRLYRLERR